MAPLSAAGGRLQSVASRALAPHWGALLALALFLIAGLAVLDHYGAAVDGPTQRRVARANLDYLANGGPERFLTGLRVDSDKFYGAALEAPMLLVERVFGLSDVRGIYMLRHLLLHLCYLAGGLFAYLLARRLFHNRALAVTATLIFLLHPRLYAHSFFNSKDIPFLAMFIIALFLAHRAFSRDRVGAFALLGVGVGVLVNLRIMGVVLLAAIPALRALDLAFAQGWPERKRIILSTGAFALTAALAAYVLMPYLWADPVARAAEWWTTLSNHPTRPSQLFRGTLYLSTDLPPSALPFWFAITAPPFALFLGLIGAAAVLMRSAPARIGALRNTRQRFRLLALGCFALPVVGIILLNANAYDEWRHVYFIWAPFSLLAAYGLGRLSSGLRGRVPQAAVYGLAGVGLAATVVSASLIHPNQQESFNFLVDRVAPEHLRTRYVMDPWSFGVQQAVAWLSRSGIAPADGLAAIDLATVVHRVRLPRSSSPDAFVVGNFPEPLGPALHTVSVYANTLATVRRKSDLRMVYETVRRREPFVDSAFDMHRLGGDLALVKEPCAPSFWRTWAHLKITPLDVGDIAPEWKAQQGLEERSWRLRQDPDAANKWKAQGFEERSWPLVVYGAVFDGKCVALVPYPDYPVADIEVEWSPPLLDDNEARDAMLRAKEEGRPLARSAYDMHLVDGELVYIQEPCNPDDTGTRFFLNIHPKRAGDLPDEWRARGYEHEHRRFDFRDRGALLPGACVALFPLPDYPIAGFRTGQRIDGGVDLWRASFSSDPERYRAVYRAAASSEPLARGVFDAHLADGALVYVKEPCGQADMEARFFLHVVPRSEDDLPEDRREYGFNGLDFDFFLNGAWFDGKCAARVAIPDYPVVSVRTGQHVSGEREIWSVELAVGR